MQILADDDWRDYLDRLAHGVRQMTLTHPRVFPLVATHPTAAPWLRPPIRSLRWVDSFLQALQDHHFPPPAAVLTYKQFSTFLLGHLLLEVAALGLDHPDRASAPRRPLIGTPASPSKIVVIAPSARAMRWAASPHRRAMTSSRRPPRALTRSPTNPRCRPQIRPSAPPSTPPSRRSGMVRWIRRGRCRSADRGGGGVHRHRRARWLCARIGDGRVTRAGHCRPGLRPFPRTPARRRGRLPQTLTLDIEPATFTL